MFHVSYPHLRFTALTKPYKGLRRECKLLQLLTSSINPMVIRRKTLKPTLRLLKEARVQKHHPEARLIEPQRPRKGPTATVAPYIELVHSTPR